MGSFLGTGVYVMQLTDFPIFQRLNGVFEFARLNKCTIEFIPKFNMTLNQNFLSGGTAAQFASSTTGTLITAIDQIPINGISIGSSPKAVNWVNDSSNSTGTSSAAPYRSDTVTPGYVRGLSGSREKELYKKHKISFYPAFYDYVQGSGNTGLSVNAFERRVKRWVCTNSLGTAAAGNDPVTDGSGPLYYGPMYAFDVNAYAGAVGDNINIALFDVRLKYSMSFMRMRGV